MRFLPMQSRWAANGWAGTCCVALDTNPFVCHILPGYLAMTALVQRPQIQQGHIRQLEGSIQVRLTTQCTRTGLVPTRTLTVSLCHQSMCTGERRNKPKRTTKAIKLKPSNCVLSRSSTRLSLNRTREVPWPRRQAQVDLLARKRRIDGEPRAL